jgi:predicted SnoaL-like aldol condensation-catalyzing enzyme
MAPTSIFVGRRANAENGSIHDAWQARRGDAALGGEVTERTKQERTNLRLVRRIYEEVLGPIDSGAVDALFDPGYIQHNPSAATGSQGLKDMLDRAKVKYPKAEHRVKRMLADGDLVAVHVHVIFNPGDEGFAVVDIFRIAHGKIAEHWDVMQPITTGAKNNNGRF